MGRADNKKTDVGVVLAARRSAVLVDFYGQVCVDTTRAYPLRHRQTEREDLQTPTIG